MLFFNDFLRNMEKITEFVDMSKSYDVRLLKLPVLGGTYD